MIPVISPTGLFCWTPLILPSGGLLRDEMRAEGISPREIDREAATWMILRWPWAYRPPLVTRAPCTRAEKYMLFNILDTVPRTEGIGRRVHRLVSRASRRAWVSSRVGPP
jgi:hypothetical protein